MPRPSSNPYAQVFGSAPFRSFWTGFSLSAMGDAVSRVALTWFVYEQTGSAEALGLLNLLYTGPVVVGGLVAGWLLDRFGARRVLIWDSVLRGIVVLAIPLLYALGALALWHIYAVAAVHGFLMMVPLAGGPTLVPRLVKSEHLATANALEMLSFTLSGVIGPPLAGWLIGATSAPAVILLDAGSFLLFALLLLGVRMPPAPHPEAGGKTYRLSDAFQLLRGNAVLRTTTFMYMALNLGFGAVSVCLPIVADRVLGGGAELYGLLLGILAVGEVISSVLVGAVRVPLTLGTLICAAEILSGLALGLLPVNGGAWTAGLSLMLFGAFSAPLTVWAQTLRMRVIPAPLRGRTFALLRMLMQSGGPLGSVLAGWLLPMVGLGALLGGAALTVAVAGAAGSGVRELREAN